MSLTILYEDRVTAPSGAAADGSHLWLSPADFDAATGWKLEDEGLCRGDACVRTDARWVDARGRLDLLAFASHLGQPAVHDEAHGAWAFGEPVSALRDQVYSLLAPDFTLPDLDGKMHALSDYRGKKVFLHSWGSY